MNARPKASDIADDAMIDAVRQSAQPPAGWANRWDVAAFFPDLPDKVVLAKSRQLIKRDVLGGCGCGCRGDWHVLDDMEGRKEYGRWLRVSGEHTTR